VELEGVPGRGGKDDRGTPVPILVYKAMCGMIVEVVEVNQVAMAMLLFH